MPRVAILLHEHDDFNHPDYFLAEMAEVWRANGLEVRVLQGTGRKLAADLAILHVDLTTVPTDHLAFARQFSRLLNGRVTDISKRRISAHLVRRGDGYDGPVLVKTNRNHGGVREARLAALGPRLRRYAFALRNALPWSFRSQLSTLDYPVFESVREVPRAVWYNPDLVVERFLPERQDGYYCLRTWMFLGDKETSSICFSNEPIVKSRNIVGREKVARVPDELRRLRGELGFDYGKFDYAIADGRVVLYDANPTPAMGSMSREQLLPGVRLLAEGIRAYL